MRAAILPVVLLAAMLAVGCSSNEPLKVSTVQVGRSLNSDDSVGNITTRFKPDDTMYVSILTGAAGSGTLTARWTRDGRVINETSKDVSYRDAAATEFHINFPGGFPPGTYRVEVLLDGQQVATRDLTVEK